MTRIEAWLAFAVIGVLIGAVSMYFGYPAWLVAIAMVVVAFLTRGWAALAGALVGIGAGASALLWIGSRCPPSTSCGPAFSLELFVAFGVVALGAGLMASVAVLLDAVRRAHSKSD